MTGEVEGVGNQIIDSRSFGISPDAGISDPPSWDFAL
jgi:hypothetical protein